MWKTTYPKRFSTPFGAIGIGFLVLAMLVLLLTTDSASAMSLVATQQPFTPCDDPNTFCVLATGTEDASGNDADYTYPSWGPWSPPPQPIGPWPGWFHLGPKGVDVSMNMTNLPPGETVKLTSYARTESSIWLGQKDNLEILVAADGTVTTTIHFDPRTIPGPYYFEATGSFGNLGQTLWVAPASEEATDFQRYFVVTDLLNYRVRPNITSPVDAVLPTGSFLLAVGYPRSASGGSLWYPVASEFRPNKIYWVNSIGLEPSDAEPPKQVKEAMQASVKAFIDRNSQRFPAPNPSCIAGTNQCLQIVEPTP